MKDRVDLLYRQWGQDVERNGECWKAFLQPVRERGKEGSEAVTPAGGVDWRRWLYVGPAEHPLAEGEVLACAGERFIVRERTAVRLGTVTLGERAVLIQAKEAAL